MDNTKTNRDEPHTHTHTHTHSYSISPILDIPIFTKLYDFYKNLTQTVTKFPKTKRYTLGQKLDNIALEIFELLFSVSHAESKIATLQQISTKLDLLKVLLRLSKDSQAATNKDYLDLQAILQEIGRMLGGWIRSTKQNNESSY